jgi:hypothetical protein
MRDSFGSFIKDFANKLSMATESLPKFNDGMLLASSSLVNFSHQVAFQQLQKDADARFAGAAAEALMASSLGGKDA